MTVLDLAPTIVDSFANLAAHLPADIPNPPPVQPPGTEGVSTLLGWLKWIGYAFVAGAIIVGGILIAISFRRGEGHDALPKILWPCLGAVVIGAGTTIISSLAGA